MRSLVLTLAALLASPSSARAQARRPYVQLVTETGGTIVWRSVAGEPSRVCWGEAPEALSRSTGSGALERDHAVRIEGLAPGSTVYYAAAASSCPPPSGGAPDDRFTTAPPRGGETPFRAWLVGDSGTGGARQLRVRDAMLAATVDRPIDLFLHVGDMAYDSGTTAEFDGRFFSPYAEILSHVPVWAAIGNHESYTADTATQTGPFYEAYVQPTAGEAGGLPSGTEAYYAFDWGNVHFVVLDTQESDRTPRGAMLTWLDMDLSANDQEWTVAFFHHPPYSHGSHDSDAETQLRQVRENIVPLLDAHGVDLVLTGHSHIYERSFLVRGAYDTPTTAAGHVVDSGDGRLDGDGAYESGALGAVHVVAGHGGASVSGRGDHPLMFFSEVAYGSCLLDVRGPLLTLTNVRDDGAETDEVALAHRDGPFLLAPAGGERVLAGSTFDVRWAWPGTAPPAEVRLELSLDDGRTFVPLAARTANDGVERVTFPAFFTESARIRLAPADVPSPADVGGTFALVARGSLVAIPMGSVWSYSDDGRDPGPGFFVGTGGPYPEGAAELGYGDGDEATVLSSTPTDPSILFRRRVEIGGRVTRATVRARYDDGIAVLVNGTSVLERDVDAGLAYAALATGGTDDNQLVEAEVALDAFAPGENWIAAIVKQQSLGSSDLSFDLELLLEVEVDGTPVTDADAGPSSDGDAAAPDAAGLDAARRDAAGPDGGAGGGASGGCGCRAVAPAPTSGIWLTVLLGVWAVVHRRTAARRSILPAECARVACSRSPDGSSSPAANPTSPTRPRVPASTTPTCCPAPGRSRG